MSRRDREREIKIPVEGIMKIFMSWSGERSHAVAICVRDWLVTMFEAIGEENVFLSSEDIAKGKAWFPELMDRLEDSSFGILCLSRETLTSAWVMFEAGALAKHLAAQEARVVPLLIGVSSADLPSPLSQLNGAALTREDMQRVARSVNSALGQDGVDARRLERQFGLAWPAFEVALKNAVTTPVDRLDYDVFLSSPMAGFTDEASYRAGRAEIEKVFVALTVDCGLRVFWAAQHITTKAMFEAVDVSADKDLRTIERSRYFMLVYPHRLPTSALFEAGYAFALKKPSRYFTPQFRDLPFLLRKLTGLRADSPVSVHTDDEWADYDALAMLLRAGGREWFPTS
jgi:hypothetical protein